MSSRGESGFSVTPWEVRGVVDYDRLVKEFGTELISDELMAKLERAAGASNHMLRRRVFFSHRDLNLVLDDYEAGRGFYLYTGRGPSGPMHIGHIIPFYFAKWLQDRFNTNLYIQITDDEKFLEESRGLTLDEARRWSHENILDIIAVGFNTDKTFIFQDSEYMGNMYPLALKVARMVNFSWVRAVFGFDQQTNIGMVFYPAIQVVPTLFEKKRCLIPAAIDQDPYWRVQRDIAENLGFYKTAAIHSRFLPPLIGFQGKMSASEPETAIYLNDTEEAIHDKIWKHAFSGGQATVELHRKMGGNPDIDVPYQWLYTFFEEDDAKLKQMRDDYISGKLLSGEIKLILIEKVKKFIEEHQRRRQEARSMLHLFKQDGALAREMWKKVHR